MRTNLVRICENACSANQGSGRRPFLTLFGDREPRTSPRGPDRKRVAAKVARTWRRRLSLSPRKRHPSGWRRADPPNHLAGALSSSLGKHRRGRCFGKNGHFWRFRRAFWEASGGTEIMDFGIWTPWRGRNRQNRWI